ncbi:hypothetical protein FRC10_005427 [Ceratobasidium sp. 414]|nr:hypothetical protein FRC10_005427 [Ceratobasidium sp. 414]
MCLLHPPVVAEGFVLIQSASHGFMSWPPPILELRRTMTTPRPPTVELAERKPGLASQMRVDPIW